MHENYISNQNHLVYGSSLFCDSSTFRFVHISPSAPMIISGTITLVTVFQFILNQIDISDVEREALP
ncbi:hypothetical protein T08_16404 [Trichinella sp. T8]|nr:hypothetical protein T08_16404 [Trichinella sp. T8]